MWSPGGLPRGLRAWEDARLTPFIVGRYRDTGVAGSPALPELEGACTGIAGSGAIGPFGDAVVMLRPPHL